MSNDLIKWWPTITVTKYNDDTAMDVARFLNKDVRGINGDDLRYLESYGGLVADDVLVREGNELLNGGKSRIAALITGGSGNPFNNTYGVIGVGSGDDGFDATDTALQGASQYYRVLEGSSVDGAVIKASALFAAGTATFDWEEWGLAIATTTATSSASFSTATSSGVMVNRKVVNLGTKGASAIWTLAAEVTIQSAEG